MKDFWYSMCVFVPTFKSMMRGERSKQKKACITTGYEKPTKENWLSLCVGRRTDTFWSDDLTYAQYVYKLYCETKESCKAKGWWKREE
jgi:hypothetical protein